MSIVAGRIDDRYIGDFYAWSQGQAALLRSLKLLKTTIPEGLDLETIAEEIEDLGKAELHAVESYVRNIFIHLIKAASDPDALAFAHWRTETGHFQVELKGRYAPSMQQLIAMQAIWRGALKVAALNLREWNRLPDVNLPRSCPFQIEYLLQEDFDFDRSVAQLVKMPRA